MNIKYYLTVVCILAGTMHIARAQEKVPSTAPTTTQSNRDRILPELKFDGVTLDDVMIFLGDVAGPQFSATVVRDPGVPNDYPLITMHAKNVTVPQCLEFLQRAYGIESTPITGPAGPIYLVSVKLDDRVKAYLVSGTTSHTGSTFHVFDISDVTQRLALTKQPNSGPDQYKQAMNDVLSLVQAALEQTTRNVRDRPTLKVHEGTQVLLFSGTPAQEQVVSNVLETLKQQDSQHFKEQDERIHRLNFEASNRNVELANSEQTIKDLRGRVKALEKELDTRAFSTSAPSTTAPKE